MFAELITWAVLATPAGPAQVPLQPGDPVGRLSIPALDLRAPIREGTNEERVLNRGIGHISTSDLPGEGDTVSLWAHRVTPTLGKPYGPFRYLDTLERGDRIVYRLHGVRHVYVVDRHWTKPVAEVADVIHWYGREYLFIAACHPPGSAAERYIIRARPVSG